jgi:hypothetical protein
MGKRLGVIFHDILHSIEEGPGPLGFLPGALSEMCCIELTINFPSGDEKNGSQEEGPRDHFDSSSK